MNAPAMAASGVRPTTQAWAALALLILINTLAYADRNLFSILIPFIKEEFGSSDAVLGLLAGPAFVIPYILLSIPMARLGDRWSRSGAIAICATVWGLASTACGLASQFFQLAIARVIVGAGEAGAMPSSQAIIADLFPPHRRAGASGALAASVYLGLIVGIAGGGAIASVWGWRVAFIALSLPVIALLPLLLLVVPLRSRGTVAGPAASEQPGRSMLAGLVSFLQMTTLRNISIGVGVFHMLAYAATTWMPAYLVRSHGMNVMEAATWLGFGAAFGGLGGSVAGGLLADRSARHGEHWRLRVPAIGMFAAFPVCVVMFLLPRGVELAGIPVVAILLFVFSFLSALWAAPCYAAVSNNVPADERAQAIATMIVLINLLGSVLGPPAAGAVSDLLTRPLGEESIRYSLLVLTGLTLIGGTLLWRASGHMGIDQQHDPAAAPN